MGIPRQGVEPISIHALRGEGDEANGGCVMERRHFNPRPPRGGRRKVLLDFHAFQNISIHALRGEGDWQIQGQQANSTVFQSTPSEGRATGYD